MIFLNKNIDTMDIHKINMTSFSKILDFGLKFLENLIHQTC